MSKHGHSTLGTAATLALSCVLPMGILTVPASLAQTGAQERTIDLGEVVVTATKRVLPLIDVPVAVSVITGQDIAARGFTEYADYLSSLPGVYFDDAGPTRSAIRIRGLVAAEGGLPTLVATYFGETPTSVDGTYPNLRLVDIERVEVLRGPQGTLFGANALAGAVRILPALPNLEDYEVNLGTRGFTTAHSDDESYHVEGVLNLPFAGEKSALRLVGYKDDIAGYIDNRFPGRPAFDYSFIGDILFGLPPGTLPPGTLVNPAVAPVTRTDINTQETVGGRMSAAWQATDRLRFDLGYTTQEATLESEPHVTPSVGEYAQSRALDVFSQGRGEDDTDIASLTLRYDWDTVSLTSASSSASYDVRQFSDVSENAVQTFGVPLPAELRTEIETDAITQELRLQSRGPGAFQWLFGVFYLDRDRNAVQDIPDYSCPMCIPVLLQETTFFRAPVSFDEEQKAVFGELSYDLSPRWTVSAGARYLEQDLHLLISGVDGVLATTLLATNARDSAEEFNPSASLRFRPSDDLTLYAQAARGFRSGRPNNALSSNCQPEAQNRGVGLITEADTLWNYEIGFKSLFADDRLSLNAAVYDADWSGIQINIALACNIASTINGGDATTRGAEVEFVAQPSNAWRFNLAASYTETEFDRVNPTSGFIDGERVPGSPKTNASAGVQYDFDMGNEWSGFARADYQYVGEIRHLFGLGPTRQVFDQDDYGTGNVRLGLARDNLALEIYARNVADKRAVTTSGNPNPIFGGDQLIVRPRELGVQLRYSYQ